MFRKKEIVYFVGKEGTILVSLKRTKMIPRKGEIIILKPDDKKYSIVEIVYTLDKNYYICWIYLKENN